jgi:hypothetical protein
VEKFWQLGFTESCLAGLPGASQSRYPAMLQSRGHNIEYRASDALHMLLLSN